MVEEGGSATFEREKAIERERERESVCIIGWGILGLSLVPNILGKGATDEKKKEIKREPGNLPGLMVLDDRELRVFV